MKTNKIYARQVAPEYQDSYIFDDEMYTQDISYLGNKDYQERFEDLHKVVYDIVDYNSISDDIEDVENDNCDYYTNLIELFNDTFYQFDKIDEVKANSLKDVFMAYNETKMYLDDTLECVCEVLEILTNKKHDYKTIRGCCQRDWQYILYDCEVWDDEQLKDIESMYFNLGSEWIISESEDEEGYSAYYTDYDEQEIKKKIANSEGVDIQNVVMYAHDGYKTESIYKII